MTKQIPRGALLAAVGIAALLLAERRWPRRVQTQTEPARTARNVALGAMALAVVTAGQGGARRLATRVERDRLGLAQLLPTPVLRDAAAFLLLDYTM